MPSARTFHIVFWSLIGGLLFWQFTTYNNHLNRQAAAAPPKQEHFFFNAQTSAPPVPPKPDAAEVKQVNFSYTPQSPDPGSFTCHVALKNVGKLKAVNVQIRIAPFRGAWSGDPNGGRDPKSHVLTDNDPVTQVSQMVVFPDMAPGETVTKDVTFLNQYGFKPGNNYQPTIMFDSEKPQNGAPASATPPAR